MRFDINKVVEEHLSSGLASEEFVFAIHQLKRWKKDMDCTLCYKIPKSHLERLILERFIFYVENRIQ